MPSSALFLLQLEVARYIRERHWAKEQCIIDEPDGSIVMHMKTSGWMDVQKWILSFGPDAELLEPNELRLEIKKKLLNAVDLYKS
jgi:predicted DNA-binding transcriptional regulator YafY